MSGLGSIFGAIIDVVSGWGLVQFDRDYSDKGRKKREEAAWREKHGSKWPHKK